MTEQNYWHLLFVDDNTEVCELADKYLNEQVVSELGEKLRVTTEVDFDKALDRLESGHFDFVVLDVRRGPHGEEREEEEGIKVLESIKARCFIPVIFYTGLPQKVRHLETPLIQVVENTEGLPKVVSIVKEILSTRIPLVNRALLRHVKEVQRDYMWDFVARNWEKFGDTPDRTSLAYLLARRLAKSLDGPGIQQLAEELGDTSRLWCDEEHAHPMRYYVIPPMGERTLAGDIFLKKNGNKTHYMVLITPSCDISQKKADMMLFACCSPLVETHEYKDWRNNPEDPKGQYKGNLWALLQNRKSERYFLLPGIFDLPDMVVDFQKLVTLEINVFNKMKGEGLIKCIASLDSPYSESLIARFTRYYGRLGVPDLNIELIGKKLTNGG